MWHLHAPQVPALEGGVGSGIGRAVGRRGAYRISATNCRSSAALRSDAAQYSTPPRRQLTRLYPFRARGTGLEANKDVTARLQAAVAKLNELPQRPSLVLHTGDITQLAKPEEFDTASEVLKGVKTDRVFYVPGEHDVATDNGVSYLQRYGKGTKGAAGTASTTPACTSWDS